GAEAVVSDRFRLGHPGGVPAGARIALELPDLVQEGRDVPGPAVPAPAVAHGTIVPYGGRPLARGSPQAVRKASSMVSRLRSLAGAYPELTMAGGEAALSAGVLIGSTLTTVLIAGPVLRLEAASGACVRPAGIIASLALVVAVPLAAGLALRWRVPRVARLAKPAGTTAMIAV